jgi:hypothetical protein
VTVALSSLVVAAGATWHLLPRSPINRENFEQIEIGMPAADVEGLLGLAAGDHSSGKLLADDATSQHENEILAHLNLLVFELEKERMPGWRLWRGDRGIIAIRVDAAGLILEKDYLPVRLREPSRLEKIRRWLRR